MKKTKHQHLNKMNLLINWHIKSLVEHRYILLSSVLLILLISLLFMTLSSEDVSKINFDEAGQAIATCYDGIQNQGETGIDCGNLCKPCGKSLIPLLTNPISIIYFILLISLLIIIFIHPKHPKKDVAQHKIKEKLMQERKKELAYYKAIEKLEKTRKKDEKS